MFIFPLSIYCLGYVYSLTFQCYSVDPDQLADMD